MSRLQREPESSESQWWGCSGFLPGLGLASALFLEIKILSVKHSNTLAGQGLYVLSFMYALSAGSQCYAHTLPLLLPSKGFKDLEGIVKMEEVRGAQENILSLESFLTPRKGIKYQDPLKKRQPSH